MAKKKVLKKAQKGTTVKATTDSTDYFNKLSKINFDKASEVRNAPYGGRPLKEQLSERSAKEKEYNKKAFEAINNQLRQSRKGKPGYDKNGFPIKKKMGGIIKNKK